jgi:mRNA interferase MazF
MTNQIKGYPFEVRIPDADSIGGGVILSDQIKSLSWEARKSSFKARASESVLLEVLAKVKALMGV